MEQEWQGNTYVPSLSDFQPDPLSRAQEKIIAKKYERMRSLFLYDVCISVAVVGSQVPYWLKKW